MEVVSFSGEEQTLESLAHLITEPLASLAQRSFERDFEQSLLRTNIRRTLDIDNEQLTLSDLGMVIAERVSSVSRPGALAHISIKDLQCLASHLERIVKLIRFYEIGLSEIPITGSESTNLSFNDKVGYYAVLNSGSCRRLVDLKNGGPLVSFNGDPIRVRSHGFSPNMVLDTFGYAFIMCEGEMRDQRVGGRKSRLFDVIRNKYVLEEGDRFFIIKEPSCGPRGEVIAPVWKNGSWHFFDIQTEKFFDCSKIGLDDANPPTYGPNGQIIAAVHVNLPNYKRPEDTWGRTPPPSSQLLDLNSMKLILSENVPSHVIPFFCPDGNAFAWTQANVGKQCIVDLKTGKFFDPVESSLCGAWNWRFGHPTYDLMGNPFFVIENDGAHNFFDFTRRRLISSEGNTFLSTTPPSFGKQGDAYAVVTTTEGCFLFDLLLKECKPLSVDRSKLITVEPPIVTPRGDVLVKLSLRDSSVNHLLINSNSNETLLSSKKRLDGPIFDLDGRGFVILEENGTRRLYDLDTRQVLSGDDFKIASLEAPWTNSKNQTFAHVEVQGKSMILNVQQFLKAKGDH